MTFITLLLRSNRIFTRIFPNSGVLFVPAKQHTDVKRRSQACNMEALIIPLIAPYNDLRAKPPK